MFRWAVRSFILLVALSCVVLTSPAQAHSIWHHDNVEGADADIYWSRAWREDAQHLKIVVITAPVQFLGEIKVRLDTKGDSVGDALLKIEGLGDSGLDVLELKVVGSGEWISRPLTQRFHLRDGASWKYAFFVPIRLLDVAKHVHYRVVQTGHNVYDAPDTLDRAPNYGWYWH